MVLLQIILGIVGVSSFLWFILAIVDRLSVEEIDPEDTCDCIHLKMTKKADLLDVKIWKAKDSSDLAKIEFDLRIFTSKYLKNKEVSQFVFCSALENLYRNLECKRRSLDEMSQTTYDDLMQSLK